MKRNLLFFVILMAGSIPVFAQTKTVTNADLEKFRAARLKAEQDYRENYAKWGMPSPEELERRRIESAKDLSERAARARAERIERERVEAEHGQAAAYYDYLRSLSTPAPRYTSVPSYNPYYYPGGGYYSSGSQRRIYRSPGYSRQYGPGGTTLPTLRPPRYDFLPGSVLPTRRRN